MTAYAGFENCPVNLVVQSGNRLARFAHPCGATIHFAFTSRTLVCHLRRGEAADQITVGGWRDIR